MKRIGKCFFIFTCSHNDNKNDRIGAKELVSVALLMSTAGDERRGGLIHSIEMQRAHEQEVAGVI